MSYTMTIKALAPWFGGKRTLAPRIVAELGEHRAYWEPCCGSMAVLLAKPEAPMETVNDLHGDLINLARVIASPRHEELSERLYRTLMCDGIFDEVKAECAMEGPVAESIEEVADEHVERAWAYFVMSWQGRNGSAGTKLGNVTVATRFTSNGGSGGFRFRSAADSIPAWHARLSRVLIKRMDLFEILDRVEDKAGSAIYLDPPYVKKGTAYIHDFSGIDHHRLAQACARFTRTRVVVSYYEHKALRNYWKGWTFVPCPISKALVNQGMRDAEVNEKAPEILIINGPSFTAGVSVPEAEAVA